MARQPRHFGAKGQHRQRFQPEQRRPALVQQLPDSGLALSTANLYSAVQPGGSLYGLQHSNPVDPEVAYQGNAQLYGTPNDPLVGQKVGGVNVFGGGLALYARGGVKVGGVGVSGDQSCTDHFVAWHVRNNLKLDYLSGVGGVSGDTQRPDNIIFDIKTTTNGGLLEPEWNVEHQWQRLRSPGLRQRPPTRRACPPVE